MIKSHPARWLLLCLLLPLLAWGLFYFRASIAGLALPWLHWVVALLERTYSIAQFDVQQHKHEMVLHLRLVSDGPVTLYGVYFPKMDVSATTLVTHYLLHLFIFGAVFISSILLLSVCWWRLLPMLILGAMLSTAMDIPITLLGSIEGLVLANLAPQDLDGSLLVKLERALNNGGRMGVALGLSLLGVAFAMKKMPDIEAAQ